MSADTAVLTAAREGDETAFEQLVAPYRRELHAHCYRMLGSLHDTEDALQDALLKAWRGLKTFEGRSSLRAWLYRIATNASLDIINRRPKQRVLPIDEVPAWDPARGVGEPLTESVWIEPYPDEQLGLADGLAAPDARYEQRESVELAFIAALQHLPANQRAALILRDVLAFSAAETAELLETSVASANSALQRARAATDERMPEQSQQRTLRAIGDDGLREIVDRFVDAMDRQDVPAVVSLLAQDVAWSMPPLTSWFRGVDNVAAFLAQNPLKGAWQWKRVATTANGQPAVAAYIWDDDAQAHLPFALDVLSFDGDRIVDVTSFITRTLDVPDEDYTDWPEHGQDEERVVSVFERFGLPARLD
ncbi:MAG TPA: sigma-70 family RNA polymerase sigma factor [Solirubrobacteraceae bacterium]